MSEEILKALTQLFAIITKQDGGVSENERQFVIDFFQQELEKSAIAGYLELYDSMSGYTEQQAPHIDDKTNKLTSVKDSIKTLAICKKINKTLTQKQKIIVLNKILELVGSDKHFTPQRMEIVNTVSTVFNIVPYEYKLIENFAVSADATTLNFKDILIADEGTKKLAPLQKHIHTHVHGHLVFLRVSSVGMYFVKYLGTDSNVLNGFTMKPGRIYLFSQGSTVKTPDGSALYYSDLVADFNEEVQAARLSFSANVEEYKFSNGTVGIHHVKILEGPGKLIGIMGASGAGKTTLLNIMAGLEKPSKGQIKINGFDIHTEKRKVEGVIGYVSQDDLLIEELTVYQNLYYNARLCFANLNEIEIDFRVMKVLEDLGLDQRKDLKVGSVLDKKISGGQRKRLNIALELLRQPAVLFLDEPTSGLSSRDSENVIDLLKELSLKGKLIFVVIHQPSSDIYKMFDKMLIMDTGGYPAFYGNPVEAVTYFKRATHQVDSNRGQCEVCGNVNPEQIFNIIEAKVVDEYGQPTIKRKITPAQWYEMYSQMSRQGKLEEVKEIPPRNLHLPSRIRQTFIFATRDFLAKLSNRQYLLINLLEAPLLAMLLAFVIRYRSAPDGSSYLFRYNENFPAFMLMAIIVALFMGLTVSAEEIIRDRKILKRESFLNLSWSSYLFSKVGILFLLSAVQTLAFIIIGNWILEIQGMTWAFWLILFTTACFANVIGLNISSAFNSAVTVYVLIPLLLIPQMILSGLLFDFDKLNHLISTRGKVPMVADLMTSRWAYEAMAVHQFKNNEFEKAYFNYERAEAVADYKAAYLADELITRNQYLLDLPETPSDTAKAKRSRHILFTELRNEPYREGIENLDLEAVFTPAGYSKTTGEQIEAYLSRYKKYYQKEYNHYAGLIEKKMAFYEQQGINIQQEKNKYYNESLADLVRNVTTKERISEYQDALIQNINPVFQSPNPSHRLDYRAPFFIAEKNLAGWPVSTYFFNLLMIWGMSSVFFVALYFQWLRKFVGLFGKINLTLKK
ncbi:MAG TPA: ATP-binding cassette domain-containing protein [Cyclobacteriaceae bacterium]|jgi:ABC-type multidrug transport system ATPase subunit|nr:ATP-binding cassette domain-containing protein [Cytophagales bacterium]HRE68039.1 ATP-binding cassette domain-containing protein [Cyclobacteriaceae bacterium]HRF35152.1 ATP-binding cassette domain-containing protein [Cyclobacteriaceae bacterium]